MTTSNDREREPAEVAALWSAELPDLDLNPFLVSGTIMRLAQRLERVFTATARARGVGPAELRILLALRRSGPAYALSPTALFRSLMITSGAVQQAGRPPRRTRARGPGGRSGRAARRPHPGCRGCGS